MDIFQQTTALKCITKAISIFAGNLSNCDIEDDSPSSKYCGHLYRYCLNLSIIATKQWVSAADDSKFLDTDLAVPFYGYVTPVLAFLTIILNFIMVLVFTKRKLRSPTNIIISAIAVLDMLTILLPLPSYIQLYTLKGYTDYSPFEWCVYQRYFGKYLPTVCHSSALWLTVMLSIQRYVGITGRCRYLCTYKAVFTGIVITLVFMGVMHAILLILEDLVKARVISKHIMSASGITHVDTCYLVPRMDSTNYGKCLKIYLWVRTVFVQLLPVLILLIFNTLLLKITCNSYNYRRSLVRGNDRQRHYDLREVIRTSSMLVSLCVFALIVETPVTAMFTLVLLQNLHGINLLNLNGTKVCMTLTNIILFFSFPANFAICFGLSQKFRLTLRQTLWKVKQYKISSGFGESLSMFASFNKHSKITKSINDSPL